jgi:type III secretion protein Q
MSGLGTSAGLRPTEYSPPKWSQAEADLAGAAASLTGKRVYDSPGGQLSVAFLPFDSEPCPEPEAIAGLSFGPRTALLGLSGWTFSALHPAARGLDPARLPLELRLALLDSLFQPVFQNLSAVLGCQAALARAPETLWPTSGRTLKFNVSLLGPEGLTSDMAALALGSDDDRRWILSRLSTITRPRRADMGFLALPAKIVVGGVKLPLDEILRLTPGDLLIPDDPPIIFGQAALECPGLPQVVLNLTPGKPVTVSALGFMEEKETEVDDAKGTHEEGLTPAGPGAPLKLPGDLELNLRFEVGRRMMTLRELEALTPGQTLPLEYDPRGPVAVTCHGRKLARGQLVDLGDGRLGVLLTEVAAGAPGDAAAASRDLAAGPGAV